MPARSTPFQKLVLHIQEQLSPDCSVEESVLMEHRLTRARREVDVVVRGATGEHPVTVSLECIEHARPANVKWVEEMLKKHEHLETNLLVLVSLSGFSAQAEALARAERVRTMTPAEGCSLNWTEVVGRAELYVSRYDFELRESWLAVAVGSGSVESPAGGDVRLQVEGVPGEVTLGALLGAYLRSPEFGQGAMPLLTEDREDLIDTGFPVLHPLLAFDEQGCAHRVTGIRALVAAKRSTSPVPMRSLSWSGLPVAFGEAETVLGKTTVTVVEREEAGAVLDVTVDGKRVPGYASPRSRT